MGAHEWQFDGLVGPTHNYAGLSFGNVASERHKHSIAQPKAAALQGIAKMEMVRDLGHKQAFFLPKYSDLALELRRVGFGGSPQFMIEQAYAVAPELLASLYSAASMWAANAATVAPSSDTIDGKLHIVPANLVSKYHRSREAGFTTRQLRRIFADMQHFTVQDPLPATSRFSDEGAANHMRVARNHGEAGVHVFVYGQPSGDGARTQHFPARQHEDASRALARLLALEPSRCLYVQQSPAAIDAGVFHHDVIAMNSGMFMAHHAGAFEDGAGFEAQLRARAPEMKIRSIAEHELSMDVLVKSYFYNSQLLMSEAGEITIFAPEESAHIVTAKAQFDAMISDETCPVARVEYLDVRESMKNGGGPACLRLRVAMNDAEAAAMHQGVVLTEQRTTALKAWVNRYYRDSLSFDDLRDPQLLREVEEALDALTKIADMSGLYHFQTYG